MGDQFEVAGLVGPPGCGKTMTALALAGELQLPALTVQLHTLITKFMGETATKLHLIFEAMSRTRGETPRPIFLLAFAAALRRKTRRGRKDFPRGRYLAVNNRRTEPSSGRGGEPQAALNRRFIRQLSDAAYFVAAQLLWASVTATHDDGRNRTTGVVGIVPLSAATRSTRRSSGGLNVYNQTIQQRPSLFVIWVREAILSQRHDALRASGLGSFADGSQIPVRLVVASATIRPCADGAVIERQGTVDVTLRVRETVGAADGSHHAEHDDYGTAARRAARHHSALCRWGGD